MEWDGGGGWVAGPGHTATHFTTAVKYGNAVGKAGRGVGGGVGGGGEGRGRECQHIL